MSILLPLDRKTRRLMALMVTGTICALLIGSLAMYGIIIFAGESGLDVPPSLTLFMGVMFTFVQSFLGITQPPTNRSGEAQASLTNDRRKSVRDIADKETS